VLPVPVYLAWTSSGGITAAGAGAAGRELECLIKAVKESRQAHLALSALGDAADASAPRADGYVERSRRRCRHWAGGTGAVAFEEWAASIPPGRLADSRSILDGTPTPPITAPEGALLVDLSDRLPPAVRVFGFHAVKVLVEGVQPLVSAEGEPWAYLDADLIPRRAHGLYQPLI
jgi:hypothetical protein